MSKIKVAIVYDWIDKWGGAERILLTLHKIFPDAPFFTSYRDSLNTVWADNLKICTSFIDRFPEFLKKNRMLSLPLYPYAFESFDFKNYNLVISVSSSFAKSIITRPETFHICYLLTPSRYLWTTPDIYVESSPFPTVSRRYLEGLKRWDFVASKRPDSYIAISKNVSKRIKKFYKQDSSVIYPPFDIEYWNEIKLKTKRQLSIVSPKGRSTSGQSRQLFYLVVSRLEPYKKVDLAVAVFNKLDNKLAIVGTGSQEKRLKENATDNILFLSNISDHQLASLYQKADALIMPQEEDFGYVALEAQFFGCPVIAFKRGGAAETVIEGKTGIFFDDQTENSLREAIEKFEKVRYTLRKDTIIYGAKNCNKFSKDKFISNLSNLSYLRNLKSNI